MVVYCILVVCFDVYRWRHNSFCRCVSRLHLAFGLYSNVAQMFRLRSMTRFYLIFVNPSNILNVISIWHRISDHCLKLWGWSGCVSQGVSSHSAVIKIVSGMTATVTHTDIVIRVENPYILPPSYTDWQVPQYCQLHDDQSLWSCPNNCHQFRHLIMT